MFWGHSGHPDRFIAVGVNEGDAFVLVRGGVSALVDGGRSPDFGRQFERATRLDGVDYVICTHNDSDHANGIRGFLEAGYRCQEVWLPALWADALDDLAHEHRTLRLAGECANVSVEVRGRRPLERLGDELVSSQDREDRPLEGADTPDDPLTPDDLSWVGELNAWGALDDAVESVVPDRFSGRGSGIERLVRAEREMHAVAQLDPGQAQLFAEAVQAGQRIAAIARAAFDRGLPVRWFRFGPRRSGRVRGILRPVNAEEVARTPPAPGHQIPLLFRLALTTSNREALVFESPIAPGSPGVLFCSDSDFRFGAALPRGIGLITAPHHGSESNAGVYARVTRERVLALGAAWVRSDSRSRAGATYIARGERKYCTLCRGGRGTKHDVTLYHRYNGATWDPPLGVPRCTCR